MSTNLQMVSVSPNGTLIGPRTAGVVFHDYDLPGLKTEDGVADMNGMRGAWFSDSEGNIIAIAQPSPEMMEMAKRMRAGAAH